ncbi:hypothetical protein D3C87_1731330 [compost metagenome]
MLPLAPPLFSTMTLWPSSLESSAANSRPTESVLPPAGNGTTSLTGFVGQAPDCAMAAVGSSAAAPSVAAASTARRLRAEGLGCCMVVSSVWFFLGCEPGDRVWC